MTDFRKLGAEKLKMEDESECFEDFELSERVGVELPDIEETQIWDEDNVQVCYCKQILSHALLQNR